MQGGKEGAKQRGRSLVAVACALCLALVAASCTDDAPSTGQDPTERLVEIYSVTVTAIVDDADLPADPDADEEALLTVFLQSHDDADISAEVQVGVVNELDEWANVRFIDDMAEAVDVDTDDATVRDDGVLIGLGPVSDGDVSATVVADRYVSDDDTIVYDISVRRQGGEWTVDQPLERVNVKNP